MARYILVGFGANNQMTRIVGTQSGGSFPTREAATKAALKWQRNFVEHVLAPPWTGVVEEFFRVVEVNPYDEASPSESP